MNQEELDRHRCDPNERWPEADARGIFLTYVCGQCRASKLAKYRPDVLRNPNYEADEDIDEEPGVVAPEVMDELDRLFSMTVPMKCFPKKEND